MGAANANQHRPQPAAPPCGAAPAGTYHFIIPSELEAGREIQERILQDIQDRGYGDQSVFAIRLALEEAMVNAIKHGNRFDPQKQVRLDATVTNKQAEIIIEDQGNGFNRSGIPDPRLQNNVERCCGRGLLLMESYMDHVEYSLGGRRVRMVKINRN